MKRQTSIVLILLGILLIGVGLFLQSAQAADQVESKTYITEDKRLFEIIKVDTGSHLIICIFSGPSGVNCDVEKIRTSGDK